MGAAVVQSRVGWVDQTSRAHRKPSENLACRACQLTVLLVVESVQLFLAAALLIKAIV